MPTNTQVTAALQAQTVPPDRECVQNGTDIVQLVQDFMSIVTTAGETPGSPTDSIAQQALQIANIALATANQALAATPNVRASAPIAIGNSPPDSTLNIAWSPALPNTNYAVLGTYYGLDQAITAYYNFRVVDASRTTTGCTIRFDNQPASTKWAYLVIALPTP